MSGLGLFISFTISNRSQFHFLLFVVAGLILIFSACDSDSRSLPASAATVSINSPTKSSTTSSTTSTSTVTLPTQVLTNPTTIQTSPAPTPSTKITSQKPFPPVGWQNLWLKGQLCRPPCWEGITPGQTGLDEAVQLLNQSSIVAAINVHKIDPALNNRYGSLTFYWLESYQGRPLDKGGTIYYSLSSNTKPVYSIVLNLSPIRLSEVIKAYGEPSAVIAHPVYYYPKNKFSYSTYLVYLSQGFTIYSREQVSKPVLETDMTLDSLGFYAAGDKSFFEGLPPLLPWQGFKDWLFYCRNFNRPGNEDCTK